MSRVTIDLLGGFRLTIDGTPPPALPVRVQALVAYLACQSKPAFRDKVAGMIWARSGEAQARQSLRQALFTARQAFGTAAKDSLVFDTSGGMLSLKEVAIDVSVLNEAAASPDLAVLKRASTLYRGEFLSDFPCISEEFDEWRLAEQAKYAFLAADILKRLASSQLSLGDREAALATARQLLSLDPFREDAHRLLMEIYADMGRKAEALRQYESCVRILRDQLNTAPDKETTELSLRLKSPQPPAPAAAKPQTTAPAENQGRPDLIEKERRYLTVMFCDVVGSLGLPRRLDPEDLSEVIDGYRKLVGEVVKTFGGTVAQYVGDGIVAYFGYPTAHDNDAECAVSAGLEIASKVQSHSIKHVEGLEVRIGIASGLVVIGDLNGSSSAERLAVGETPNIAARLQTLAPAQSVIIDDETRRLIGGLFEIKQIPVPKTSNLGVESAYLISGLSAIETRFDALQPPRRAPLVDREEEAEVILRRWKQVKDGFGQVVLLCGEAGIGKSRLASHMLNAFRDVEHNTVKLYCSPLQAQNALFPFTAYLKRLAGFSHNDNAALRRQKLMQLLRDGVFSSQLSGRDAELLAELMGLETAKTEMARGDSQKREQIFAAIIGMLLAATRQGPLVLMLDDGQWLDATSLDLLARLISNVADSPILMMITARPEFKPIWQDQPHVTVISLGRLKRKDCTALIAAVANSSHLSPAFADQIYARTDGVPLFIEELTKAVVERRDLEECNDEALLNSACVSVIPSSLQGSLLARLDRLGEVKRIVQIGAAIGREFSYSVLQSVVGLEEKQLTTFLNATVESGLLYVRGSAPESAYIFKHALLQDAAYETILKKQRRQLHAKIALRVMEDCRRKGVSYPEILAHHLTLADDYPAAIEHWLESGKAQVRVSGDVEAIAIFRKALSLLDKVLDTSLRNRLELQLQVAIVGPLVAIKGPPADEVAKCCERGLQLARGLNDPALLFPFFYGQYVHSISRGNLRHSAEIAADLINTARTRRYKSGEVLGNRLLGLSLTGLAEFDRARKALETALHHYTPERDDTITYRYGQNPKISSQTVLSLVLYMVGDLEGCVEVGEECIEAAEKLDHPHTLAIALHYYGCDVCSLMGRFDKTYAYSQKVVAVSKEYGFGYFGVVGSFYNGLARYKTGEAGGLLQMEQGLAALEKMAFRVGVPFYLTFLVEANIEQGLFREALELAEKAERVMKSTEECWIEPEVLSVKGSALLHAKPAELKLAGELMKKAILKAREIGSPTLELRCSQRRHRLFSGQGAR